MRKICDEHEALLVFDEIQDRLRADGQNVRRRALGRIADIMTVAKSLGGGIYPISATIFKEEIMDFFIPHPFIHLSTFGGSDLVVSSVSPTIEYIQKNRLAEHAEAMGQRFGEGFRRLLGLYPGLLLEVRRKGLMMGLQYTNESIGPRLTKKLSDRGVLAIYTGNDPSICRLMRRARHIARRGRFRH